MTPTSEDESPLIPRPDILPCTTYKLVGPGLGGQALYMTVSDAVVDDQLRPFEVFFNTKHAESYEFFPVLGRALSAHLRNPGPFPAFIVRELIDSWGEAGYIIPRTDIRCGGIVSHIGYTLQEHCARLGVMEVDEQFRMRFTTEVK